MGKIYDANGAKMNVAGICNEVLHSATDEQRQLLKTNISKYEGDAQLRLAHGILDSYRFIDSVSEQGIRFRKLLDNLMTKYQKSTPSVDDQAQYNYLVQELTR